MKIQLPSPSAINNVLAKKSLKIFIEQAWPIVDPHPFVPGWHIDAISEHLEAVTHKQIRNLIINVPPRHGKSILTAVMWFAWSWLQQPSARFLYASYALSLSVRDSVISRALIDNPWYRSLCNFTLHSSSNTKLRFDNDKFGYRMATSVDGALTGEGGDIIVIDDAHNVRQAESAVSRQSVLDWWDMAMSTRLNDPKTGARVIICQRVHHNDIVGHILETERNKWELLKLPAEYEENDKCRTSLGWADPRKKDGELLWSARYNRKDIDDLKIKLGSYGTAGQLQQRPAPRDGGIIKLEWIKIYKELPEVKMYSWSIDSAIKTGTHNDYTVMQYWAMTETGYYLVYMIRKKLEYPELKKISMSAFAAYPASEVLIEDKSSGQQLIQDFQRLTKIPVISMRPGKDMLSTKDERLRQISPLYEAGKVLAKEGEPWLNDYIDELTSFPSAPHDDIVDAATQYLSRRQNKIDGIKVRFI